MTLNPQHQMPEASSNDIETNYEKYAFPRGVGQEQVWIVHRDLTGEFRVWEASAPTAPATAVVSDQSAHR